MSKNYQICSNCVMDNVSDPEISFINNICNHCILFRKKIKDIENNKHMNLEKIIDAIKVNGKGKEYDCIIGISGGVDSSFVAYVLKKHGLNPLAVHLDNGWNSELAVANIQKILNLLKIDLHTHVLKWEEFKELQKSFFHSSVANIEVPTDHAINAILFEMAAKLGIKYIVSGGNIATEGIMSKSWGACDNRDWKNISAIHKIFSKNRLIYYPHFNLLKMAYYIFIKRIRFITILDYIPYVKTDAIKILETELGWQNYGGKHFESVFTRFFQAYILPRKFKFDKRRPHFSTLINSGEMTREQACRELENAPYASEALLTQDKEFVLKKLGFSEEEFEKIMESPIKQYQEYPSNAWFFYNSFLINLSKKIIKRT